MGETITYYCDICKAEIKEGDVWDVQMDRKQIRTDQQGRDHSETDYRRFFILCEEHYKKISGAITEEKKKANTKRIEAAKRKCKKCGDKKTIVADGLCNKCYVRARGE